MIYDIGRHPHQLLDDMSVLGPAELPLALRRLAPSTQLLLLLALLPRLRQFDARAFTFSPSLPSTIS